MKFSRSGLLRHPDFLKLWFGQTISEFGSRISRGGIPLIAVINLGASPIQMGWLMAAASLPVLLFGLIAGAWVDRLPRRPLMIALDLTRFVLLLFIPLAAFTGGLRFEALAAILAALSVMGVVFDAAYRAYLPQLIGADQLMEGNSKLAVTDSLAEIGGPAVTGLLVQAIGAPLAVIVDSFTFLVGAGSKAAIRKHVPPPAADAAGAPIRREIAEGFQLIWGQPILKALAAGVAVNTFFGSFFGALYDFYVVRELGISPAVLGLLIAGGGVGALIGAALVERLVRRFGIGRAMIGGLLVGAILNFAIPLAGAVPREWSPILLLAAQIGGDGALMIFWISEMSFRQRVIPGRLLGRTHASFEFLAHLVMPAGALIAGMIAAGVGAQFTLLVAMTGTFVMALWLTRSPVRNAQLSATTQPPVVET
ncbi:MAG: MFS transporter [Anaerolineae bacterium]|nr:MFS transporter [Anaerolineae bacterium]NUQ03007.1 MFS transporter [Anaerolineae bacterium]